MKKINIKLLEEELKRNIENSKKEIKRVFHGRGNFYNDFSYLTVDSINEVLYICFFEEKEDEQNILELVFKLSKKYKTVLCQRRYKKEDSFEVLKGELKNEYVVYENNLKYNISFKNKNIGLFFDMKKGREFVYESSKDKRVLNLFSYTCAFSVNAMAAGALKVVNIDMAKGALSLGRLNHQLNNLDTKKVKFYAYNILKSWSRIRKEGPYDLIIIDPPSFQRGSFAASKDYEKIIKRLNELASSKCIVLSALNAPELDTQFIKDIFNNFSPSFSFERRLKNLEDFPALNEEKSLKNLIFKNY